MKLLDLFSGIGGFSIAGQWAGFETVHFVEKDKFCQKVLKKNFPTIPIHTDIKTFNYFDKVNLLTGGFPCQGFSIAGKRKGIKDDRYLWPEMLRIIKECKPNWIIAENVSGIVAMELDNILDDLETEGYESESFIIPACAANAPHRRDRLWIVANSYGKRFNLWSDYWEERQISKNKIWHLAEIQSEWEKLKPESWASMSANYWLKNNAYFVRADDGIRARMDRNRIKALGNAIVPQVVYPMIKLISAIEETF